MAHPSLGLPPSNPAAGLPDAALRLRSNRDRIGRLAFEVALRTDPSLADRYDELTLRQLLRDYHQHVEQLARALETGESRYVTEYAEWLVPIYRRRKVRGNDVVTLLDGLREAALSVLPASGVALSRELMEQWVARIRHHRRLPGDHKGNAVARFIFKGAGLGDDTVV
jgi:hypothetical protein